MSTDDFMKTVFEKYYDSITDEIFLFIENDRKLRHDYLKLLEANKLNVLNMSIAKIIKSEFGLTSISDDGDPKSKLIQTYTRFKK